MAVQAYAEVSTKRIFSPDYYGTWQGLFQYTPRKIIEPLSVDTLGQLLKSIEDSHVDRECTKSFYYERMVKKCEYDEIIELCEAKLPLEIKLQIFQNLSFECLILMYFNMPLYFSIF